MTDDGRDAEWPVHDSETEYDPGWFAAGYDEVERPDGERARYYWVDLPTDGVTVVAATGGRVVLVEQYRPKLRRRFLSCPGGGVEDDESFVEAAARELREETGFEATSLRHLTTYYPLGTARYRRALVFANELRPSDPARDAGEFIDVHAVPVEEAMRLAREPPTTGWTLTALLLARDEGLL